MKNKNYFIVPAIAWFVLTTVLLVMPVPVDQNESWFIEIPFFDKWVHIGLFIILTTLFCWGIYKKRKFSAKLKSNFIRIALYCLIYGIVMEFIQKFFVPNRSFDAGDIVADGIGAAMGSLYSIRTYIKK